MWWIIFPLLAVVVILGSLYAYCRAFYSSKKEFDYRYIPIGEGHEKERRRIGQLIDILESVSPEREVSIRSYDGTRLVGRYYHVRDGAPLHIQFHGYRSSGYRDFCSGTELGEAIGYNLLTVDQRANGKSGGRSITFGIREKYDCKAWAEFAAREFGADTPIFLSGISMGAATVLMAGELELPSNVVGIFADCPYSTPEAIIKKVCSEDMGLPAALVYPFVQLGALLFGRFRIRGGPLDAVKNTRLPILLLHGEADDFVPCDMSREIAAVGKTVELHTFPEAGHGLSFIVDEPRYRQLTKEFTKKCLERKEKNI